MKVTLMHAAIGEFSILVETSSRMVVGRQGPDVDLELPWDGRISRRHGALWVEGGSLWYEDLGSRNGSWQGDDELVGPKRVGPGESVLIGETVLLVPTVQLRATVAEPTLDLGHCSDVTTAIFRLPHDTDDLRSTPRPRPAPDEPDRRSRRIIDERNVELRFADRDALREAWLRDISKGGVFVEMAEPPLPGTRLSVHLDTPAGRLDLNAIVVHVIDANRAAALHTTAGAGLAFTNLDTKTKDAIRDYVDGAVEILESRAPTMEVPAGDNGDVIEKVRRVLAQVEANAYYSAMDLLATASPEEITERLADLSASLQAAARLATPPQAARFQAATNALARIGRVLSSERSRLEYDFRAGHVRAYERVARAKDGSGPNLQMLRRTWLQIWPDRVDQAALHTRQAFAARQAGDIHGAIKQARQALELNPFFDELRGPMSAWEQLVRDEKSQSDLANDETIAKITNALRSRPAAKKSKERKSWFFDAPSPH